MAIVLKLPILVSMRHIWYFSEYSHCRQFVVMPLLG